MPTKPQHQSIAYEDVKDLLGIADDECWDSRDPGCLGDIYPPYLLKSDGIYAKPAFRLFGLSEEELLALRPWFPPGQYGDYAEPVLPLPCTPDEFVEFVAGAELWDRVLYLDGTFTEVWRKYGLPEDCDPSATPRAGLHGRNPASPALLTTPAMARAFAGLGGWTQHQWMGNLKEPPDWLRPAMTHGGGPPKPNLWNPAEVARLLMKEGRADVPELDHRFQTDPALAPWRDAWAPYTDFP